MLDIQHLSFAVTNEAAGKEILHDITLTVDSGRFVVITGPNGGGKSTLAKMIAGIEKPTAGKILLDGTDMTDLSITDRAKLGVSYAFQQPVRFKGITVLDLLRIASGKRLSVSEACAILSEVGLCARDYVNREVNGSLSGGELKRIEIATVLTRGTQLSVFDEPEAGIDLWSFQNLISVFERMRQVRSDRTILVISHQERILNIADEIIVLSKGVHDYFKDTYGRETHFIPNGVNRQEIKDAKFITEKFGLTKDSYILFLGRLVPEKGIRYLVEAFKDVKTDKKLVIAGGSSDTDSFMAELKDLAKDDNRIIFTGFVQGQMLDELYSNAYIYTLPSDLEGMPLSLLEAMSYGNCCLVSDIPECAEVVEDKALIFQKSNVEDLQEKLQNACDYPEMVMEMKKQAADFICKKYNWDDVVKETMKLYRRK